MNETAISALTNLFTDKESMNDFLETIILESKFVTNDIDKTLQQIHLLEQFCEKAKEKLTNNKKVSFYKAADNPTQSIRIIAVQDGKVIKSVSYAIDVLCPLEHNEYKEFSALFKEHCMQYPKFEYLSRENAIYYNKMLLDMGLEKTTHEDNIILPRVYFPKRTKAFGQTLKRRAFHNWKDYNEFLRTQKL